MNEFKSVVAEVQSLMAEWDNRLSELSEATITQRRNVQNRTVKEILGHLVDSASNNIHRIVHLQYGENPLEFPNYASNGNNDRWITIQHYQEENWLALINLWKYLNLHLVHVVSNINPEKLNNEWIAAPGKNISLKHMVSDYLRHFKLHLDEINELIKN